MKNFTPGKIGCRAPQVCLPTYSPHLSSPASRTQGRIEMLTASLQQEGGSQDASPGSLRPCKHPELPSSWPRPRTEGASAFALLREHQHRFRLPHPPTPRNRLGDSGRKHPRQAPASRPNARLSTFAQVTPSSFRPLSVSRVSSPASRPTAYSLMLIPRT